MLIDLMKYVVKAIVWQIKGKLHFCYIKQIDSIRTLEFDRFKKC